MPQDSDLENSPPIIKSIYMRLLGTLNPTDGATISKHIKEHLDCDDIVSSHAFISAGSLAKTSDYHAIVTNRFISNCDDPIAKDERALKRLLDVFAEAAPRLWEAAWKHDQLVRHDRLEGCQIKNTEKVQGSETVRLDFNVQNIIYSNAVPPVEQDGMLRPDAGLIDFLETIGAKGKEYAEFLRSKAKERWAQYPNIAPAELWKLWLDPNNLEYPPWAEALLKCLWVDKVKPRLEEEEKRPPGRVPMTIQDTFRCARAGEGRIGTGDESHVILVEPPKGLTLLLPFDAPLKIAQGNRIVGLRQVLGDHELRTYLATLLIYQDEGADPNGKFELKGGVGDILDLIGKGSRLDRRRNSFRHSSKELNRTRQHLELFSKLRVRAVGQLEAKTGDPLLDEIKDRRSGRTVTFLHSRLIVEELFQNYYQIPRAVLQLEAKDVSICMGIAQFIRKRITLYLKRSVPIEASILEWLEFAGVDYSEGARKSGRCFWDDAAIELERVASDGRLGEMARVGSGKDARLTLKPNQALVTSYKPLLAASKKHENNKRRAAIEIEKEKRRD